MRLLPTALSFVIPVMMSCGCPEEGLPPAQTSSTVENHPNSDETQSYTPGDCCYAACLVSIGGGVGFCEHNLGKLRYGECGKRSEGYCQYKGKPYAYAYWDRCSPRGGC